MAKYHLLSALLVRNKFQKERSPDMTAEEYISGIPYDAMGDYSHLREGDASSEKMRKHPPEK